MTARGVIPGSTRDSIGRRADEITARGRNDNGGCHPGLDPGSHRSQRRAAECRMPDTTFTVRPVARDDFGLWKPLWDGYNAFYGREGPTALPEATTQVTWQRFFDESEPVFALVAERAGRVVGIVHYLFHRSTLDARDSCYLQDLFTAADARGQGVGRALIEAVYGRARQADCNRVYWQTRETNQMAIALYDKVAERSGTLLFRKLF
jgi:GNAT superfamily N-acetyltransferase